MTSSRRLPACALSIRSGTAIRRARPSTELKRVHEERRPASAKQRRFIADLVKDSGLTAAEAAKLVDAASLDELTGGSEGTASELIDLLQERAKKKG